MANLNEHAHHKLTLRAITWPIFIELFLQMIMGSTDTIMLSHISDDVVAAVGVANQLVFFAILIFSFTATGTSVLVSQFLGAGLREDARRASAISITINLILGAIVSLVMVLFSDQLLSMFNLNPKLSHIANDYFSIVGGTLFLQALLLIVSAILRSHGFTRESMFISVFMNIIHLIGNCIVIYGLLGFPELGVKGVALSTAFSRALAVMVAFYFLYKRLPVKLRKPDYLNFDLTLIKKILRIGVPAAGEQISYNTSQMAMTAIIAMIGAEALSTRVYTWNIMSFIMLFGLAIGQGTQILIGYRVGARDFDGAYKQLLKSLRLSFMITIAIAMLVALFREGLMGIFTNNASIVHVGGQLLLLCLILEPGRTFNILVINSLRATGDAVFPVKVGVLSMWGMAVPVSYILGIHFGFGLAGIWVAFILDEWLRGIVMYFRWKSRVWEKKILVDEAEAIRVPS